MQRTVVGTRVISQAEKGTSMKMANRPKTEELSRRQFLGETATVASLAALSAGIPAKAYAAGTGAIRLGLIGCGGRGTGAAVQALNACERARLVAMANAFQDRLERSYEGIAKRHIDRVDVPHERRFVGMDAYAAVVDADVDMVLLCTPPGLRPLHFEAAESHGPQRGRPPRAYAQTARW